MGSTMPPINKASLGIRSADQVQAAYVGLLQPELTRLCKAFNIIRKKNDQLYLLKNQKFRMNFCEN